VKLPQGFKKCRIYGVLQQIGDIPNEQLLRSFVGECRPPALVGDDEPVQELGFAGGGVGC
jgi:hypothetical protein